MNNTSVWAHSIYLSENDLSIMKKQNAGIAQCPLSNYYFANAVFPYQRVKRFNIPIGLGTDISGGYSISMFDSCRHAVTASLALEHGVNGDDRNRANINSKINMIEAFYLSTLGGANALGIGNIIGSFKIGKSFDAILIHMKSSLIPFSSKEQKFERMMHFCQEQHIRKVWVQGDTKIEN